MQRFKEIPQRRMVEILFLTCSEVYHSTGNVDYISDTDTQKTKQRGKNNSKGYTQV